MRATDFDGRVRAGQDRPWLALSQAVAVASGTGESELIPCPQRGDGPVPSSSLETLGPGTLWGPFSFVSASLSLVISVFLGRWPQKLLPKGQAILISKTALFGVRFLFV